MDTQERSHFGFIGFGLIGGSVARALRSLYPASKIVAYNYYQTKPHKRLELAKEEGTLTAVVTSLADFSACDVVFLCAPVMTNISYLEQLVPYLNPDCILTDVGSVKGNIEDVAIRLHVGRQFVGGHPMAGSEKTGYENSDASLLKNAFYFLTPTAETDKAYTEWMKQFVKGIGAYCMVLDALSHDQMTAAISHAPHVVSASLVNAVAMLDQDGTYGKFTAGGFRSTTRIAASSPEVWDNICLANKQCILDFLEKFTDTLHQAKTAIEKEDSEALTAFFSSAKKYRDSI